jgi:hypothetical protein
MRGDGVQPFSEGRGGGGETTTQRQRRTTHQRATRRSRRRKVSTGEKKYNYKYEIDQKDSIRAKIEKKKK